MQPKVVKQWQITKFINIPTFFLLKNRLRNWQILPYESFLETLKQKTYLIGLLTRSSFFSASLLVGVKKRCLCVLNSTLIDLINSLYVLRWFWGEVKSLTERLHVLRIWGSLAEWLTAALCMCALCVFSRVYVERVCFAAAWLNAPMQWSRKAENSQQHTELTDSGIFFCSSVLCSAALVLPLLSAMSWARLWWKVLRMCEHVRMCVSLYLYEPGN